MGELDYKIIKKIGRLNNNKNTTKEINIVQWRNETYIDIRRWENDEAKKGISLNLYEAKKLRDYLDSAIASLESVVSNNVEITNYKELGIGELNDSDLKKKR